jgi:hypothetical protein
VHALIIYGGWEGHEPAQVAAVLKEQLAGHGFRVTMRKSLNALDNPVYLAKFDLIILEWTIGRTRNKWIANLCEVVREHGVGFAGLHGGAGDTFRSETEYQFMVGGQFVAHVGGILDYRVDIVDRTDPVTHGLANFNMHSEQYYMHVDPSNHVLAATTCESTGTRIPVAWKRAYGKGRVFYLSIGHVVADLDVHEALTILTRGVIWAAEGKALAAANTPVEQTHAGVPQ